MNQEELDKELWKRLLKWLGFVKAYPGPESRRVDDLWVYPSGSVDNAPELLNSLDACFVHLIPILRLRYGEDAMLRLLGDWTQEVALHYEVYKGREAFPLCRVVEEFITSVEVAEKVRKVQEVGG